MIHSCVQSLLEHPANTAVKEDALFCALGLDVIGLIDGGVHNKKRPHVKRMFCKRSEEDERILHRDKRSCYASQFPQTR